MTQGGEAWEAVSKIVRSSTDPRTDQVMAGDVRDTLGSRSKIQGEIPC